MIEIKSKSETINADDVNMPGSRFHDVNLSDSEFDDIALKNTKFTGISFDGSILHHVDFVDCDMNDVEMTGSVVRYIRLPKATANTGTVLANETVTFEHCNLRGAILSECNLSGVNLSNCDISGLTIDGMLIEHLLNAKRKSP